MSKPIRLTDETKASILERLTWLVASWKTVADIGSAKLNLADLDQRATVTFTPTAYLKMMSLVDNFDTEVAWHGVTYRRDGGFLVSDIIVYPQEVSDSTANTDQKAYEQWLYGLDDNTFNRIRLQGHSHVNFSVHPSVVDVSHQDKIVKQVEANQDYYIFLIANKRRDFFARIVDVANNIEYDTEDVDLCVEGFDAPVFLAEAASKLKERRYTPSVATMSKGGKSSKSHGKVSQKYLNSSYQSSGKYWVDNGFEYCGEQYD